MEHEAVSGAQRSEHEAEVREAANAGAAQRHLVRLVSHDAAEHEADQ